MDPFNWVVIVIFKVLFLQHENLSTKVFHGVFEFESVPIHPSCLQGITIPKKHFLYPFILLTAKEGSPCTDPFSGSHMVAISVLL